MKAAEHGRRAYVIAGVGMAVGGVMMALGSLMSWASADSLASITGVDGTAFIEGVISFVLGLEVAAIGLAAVRSPIVAWLRWAAAVFGVIVLNLVVSTYLTLGARFAPPLWNWVRADVGLVVVGLGAIIVLIAVVGMKAPIPGVEAR